MSRGDMGPFKVNDPVIVVDKEPNSPNSYGVVRGVQWHTFKENEYTVSMQNGAANSLSEVFKQSQLRLNKGHIPAGVAQKAMLDSLNAPNMPNPDV